MKTQTPYVKLLHLLFFFFFLINTSSVIAQTAYEGFGANAVGGSNSSTVYHVTNLNASGAGSLAGGIGSNRTIVFDVSGTITGRFDLIGISYLTIDGTGQNIIINGNNNGDAISFDGSSTHHCILKGIHVTNAGNDGINVLDGAHDIVITNCSSYGSRDGNIDVAGGVNVTIQYCILGGGGAGWAGDMLITATNVSVHHNLFSPATSGEVGERCPLVHSNYSPVGNPNADIRNNLVWKFGRSGGTGSGYGSSVCYNATANIINNYYYTTGSSAGSATNTDDGYGGGATGKAYIAGNVSGNNGVNANSANNHAIYTVPAVTTQDACTAAALVLANAGPRPLNATDQALINAVTLPNCSVVQNPPPTANAGSDITLTLPVNSTTLTGSGTDANGTITGYVWTRVSGPATFTLGTANAATTTLSNLVAGTYVFRLTVTDNGGATGTDDVTVTVNAAVNPPPTANAGNDITMTLPVNSATLTGSGTDANGTIAGYVWTRVSGPTTFTLGTANAATTTLSNLVAGTYVFRLTVTDNGGATGTDDVTVTVNAAVNLAPTANAGNDVTLTLPVNSTTLSGSGTDADGTIAGYAWTRVSGPTTFTLGTVNAATTTLSNLVAGTYVFRLTVTDNNGATGTDNVTITVNAAINQPPTANAGSDVTLTLPVNSITLLGSGTDADGTIAGYGWARVSGPTTFTLGTASAATTTLSNLVAGVYVFRLTVTDNNGATGTDNVTVTVNAAVNLPPTANAGSDVTLTLPVNSTTLLGSGTDADGTIAGYGWARVSGPTTFTLGTANAATTTLSNLVAGTYVFRLTVTDNNGATGTDNVTVTVNAAVNLPPTANAGSDITLTLPVNSTTLNGSGTDADGTIAGYGWTRISGPATYTLANANAATTGLSNLVAGTYVFRLTVTDNNGATATDNVTVTVNAAINQPPAANAGNNITITLPGNSTTLVGGGTDADGTIAGYAWTRVSGPTTFTLGTANAATSVLSNLVQGVYTFRLTVTDNNGATGTDDVTVTVNAAPNQAPTANGGSNITLTLPVNSTTLVGTGSDADGTISGYAWTRVSGPATYTLANANSSTTGLSNLVQGVYTFRLTVTDNNGATATDEVTVTVNASVPVNQSPVAIAGNNITLNLPSNTTPLNGSGSFDPDGTITGYAWTRVSGPVTFTLTNANTSTATLSNLAAGTYVFKLTVTDNNGATDDDNITVIVSATVNQPPSANAGNNIVLTLPLNSTNLNGGGSTDADGTIISYGWTRVSGPLTYTLANAGASATGLSNLVQGVYTFRLTVTDNNGATSTDDVTVTVNAAANQSPTANAGSDITITLPINSTMLTGSGYDPDGTIVSYAWTRVSGPATYTIVSANAATTGLNGLVQGVYVFRLTVTDNNGATATDNVTVTVNAAPPPVNQSPTANAGSDITLVLPVNSAILTGSGYDPDGTIVSYTWTRVSGPATFTLVSPNEASTGINGLVQGVYVFRLTVTDNNGATAMDNVTVTVNAVTPPANRAPTANAGADITITLPVNTATLYGSGSDPDGTIVSYAWSWVSGPATYTLANTSAATTGLYNLVQGVYVFRLTVTDNSGATATDMITVTVNAAPPPAGNLPPTARTETDITLVLPVNTTQLHGNTSTDPDGIIVSYVWTQVSGPGQAVISNGLTSMATVSDLTVGIYTFELKVTDDDGATSTKTIKVTVENQHGQGAYLKIYPNPASSVLNMQYVANTNGKYRISIYDANRRLMKDEVIEKTQVSITKTMDVSQFGAGVYFIEVRSEDSNKKVVKQFVKL